jgi:glycosyltransferase involved in cell wall biosynthesis
MNILLLAPGVSVHSQRFLQMLLDAGHQVTFVDSHNPKPEGGERYAFVPYPGMLRLDRFRHINRTKLLAWIIAVQLKVIVKVKRPQVIHLHWVNDRAYHCALANLRPLVLTCWGSDINSVASLENCRSVHRERVAYGLSHASHVTGDSLDILANCERIAAHKLPSSLWYFGIDFDEFRPIEKCQRDSFRRKIGIPEDAKLILSARALRHNMGHRYILEAFSKAKAVLEPELHLVFLRYGILDVEYENQLRQDAHRLGVADNVHWIEPFSHDQMPRLYNAADLVVNFPTEDAFPVTFFEAAACERPIVTSRLPAYENSFADQVYGLLPPADADALATAFISELSRSEDVRAKSSHQARQLAYAMGSKQSSLQRLLKIYQNLLSTRA